MKVSLKKAEPLSPYHYDMQAQYQLPPANETFLNPGENTRKAVFILCVAICLSPIASPVIALLIGIAVAQFTGHPYIHLNQKATHILLQFSVIGLGFGMNIGRAIQAGKQGVLFTIVSIGDTLLLGHFLGKWLNIEKKTSFLISSGTAICGGSAIAAISPVIKAEEKQISVAMLSISLLRKMTMCCLIRYYQGSP
jgi:uncharacterized membrane protein YadS